MLRPLQAWCKGPARYVLCGLNMTAFALLGYQSHTYFKCSSRTASLPIVSDKLTLPRS